MTTIDTLRATFPDAARDIKLNLQAVLDDAQGSLGADQRWGVAVASAIATRNPELAAAVLSDARLHVGAAVLDDAVAAASLMAMNNVYYRFRHMIGKSTYSERPARLRMNRIARPATNKADFELFCLAVSAINGCEACVRSHEQVVVSQHLTEDQVHDAVRIAATVQAAAVSYEAGQLLAVDEAPRQAASA